MEYVPDKWIIVKVSGTDPHYRVFATWSGGYLDSDSWKFNSGIKSMTEDENYYHFNGFSGSIYTCKKTSYGSTGFGWSVIQKIVDGSGGLINVELFDDDWRTVLSQLVYQV